MRVSDEDISKVERACRSTVTCWRAFDDLKAELLALRKVADAASLLEDAMAGIPCPCREKACEAMCRALREAGR